MGCCNLESHLIYVEYTILILLLISAISLSDNTIEWELSPLMAVGTIALVLTDRARWRAFPGLKYGLLWFYGAVVVSRSFDRSNWRYWLAVATTVAWGLFNVLLYSQRFLDVRALSDSDIPSDPQNRLLWNGVAAVGWMVVTALLGSRLSNGDTLLSTSIALSSLLVTWSLGEIVWKYASDQKAPMVRIQVTPAILCALLRTYLVAFLVRHLVSKKDDAIVVTALAVAILTHVWEEFNADPWFKKKKTVLVNARLSMPVWRGDRTPHNAD